MHSAKADWLTLGKSHSVQPSSQVVKRINEIRMIKHLGLGSSAIDMINHKKGTGLSFVGAMLELITLPLLLPHTKSLSAHP